MNLILKIFFFVFNVVLLSCSNANIEAKEKNQSPVSLWLINNEDSLFHAFTELVRIDTSKNKVEGEMLTREYVLTDGIFATLNERIHNVASCINVKYLLRPSNNPSYEIFLTPEFDASCIDAIDSIFADIGELKHFRISKYKKPTGPFSKFIIETDTFTPEDIAFNVVRSNGKYDVKFYIRIPTTQDAKETLKNEIFGEEILLKQINSVKFAQLTDSTKEIKNLEELWKLFNINN